MVLLPLRWRRGIAGDAVVGQLGILVCSCRSVPEGGETGVSGTECAGGNPVVPSFDNASARSVAWTCLFGSSSLRITQPCGGLGGGLMKNSFWDCGASSNFRFRDSAASSTGVCSPKYTRQVWSDLVLPLPRIDSPLLLSRMRLI